MERSDRHKFIDDLTSDVMFEASAEGLRQLTLACPSAGLLPVKGGFA